MSNMRQGMQKDYFYKMVKSPIGGLKLVASDDGLAAILWEKDNPQRVRLKHRGRRPRTSDSA